MVQLVGQSSVRLSKLSCYGMVQLCKVRFSRIVWVELSKVRLSLVELSGVEF